jgi:hypothetical protein
LTHVGVGSDSENLVSSITSPLLSQIADSRGGDVHVKRGHRRGFVLPVAESGALAQAADVVLTRITFGWTRAGRKKRNARQ